MSEIYLPIDIVTKLFSVYGNVVEFRTWIYIIYPKNMWYLRQTTRQIKNSTGRTSQLKTFVRSLLPRISLENDISRILRPSKYFTKSCFLISCGDLPTPKFRASPITHSIYFPRTVIICRIMNFGIADELYHASAIKTYH